MNKADKIAVLGRDNWTCKADGLHHADCPGRATNDTAHCFVPHHRYTKERGKRDRVPVDIVDAYTNLMCVWNGPVGPLGQGGCHGEIHTRQEEAHRLGHLLTEPTVPI